MNYLNAAKLAIMGASVIGAISNWNKVKKEEEEKRRQIDEDAKKDLAALYTAHGRIMERIEQGKYRGKPLRAVVEDMRFERIVAQWDVGEE